jgi:hypothetical protein
MTTDLGWIYFIHEEVRSAAGNLKSGREKR